MGWGKDKDEPLRDKGRQSDSLHPQGEDEVYGAERPPDSPPPRGEGLGAGGSLLHTAEIPATRKLGAPQNVDLARRLRNHTTLWERRLWDWLRTLRRTHGFPIRRQVPFGRFIADFACHSARLIIKLDGPLHDVERDRERDVWFARAGYRTLRFTNELVIRDWERVVAEIEGALVAGAGFERLRSRRQPPTPNLSPRGGEESGRLPFSEEGEDAGRRSANEARGQS
jgi:very-short-patch-repair endonuclease